MYHRFAPEPTSDTRFVDAAALRRQAALLARHHALWRPDDILAARSGKRPPGRCPVVVTVDDGYRDFHDVAYPVFREHGVPATLFVVTGFVDGCSWLWWDRLERLLAEPEGPRELSIEIEGDVVRLDRRTPEGRVDAWHRVATRCRFMPDPRKEETLDALTAALGVTLPARPEPHYAAVTWEQIREMAANQMLFGAHTVTHPILSHVSEERARVEIVDSGRRLREMSGQDAGWFCYPQGGPDDFTPWVRDRVAEAGFRGCFVAYQNLHAPADVYTLPRSCVDADMTTFRWILCGAEILGLRLRHRLGLNTIPRDSPDAGSS
jgi:peptidoglycan/xylan/chitin deacetylase (PgdA/CDA1 family)